jgi:hypothetical protein
MEAHHVDLLLRSCNFHNPFDRDWATKFHDRQTQRGLFGNCVGGTKQAALISLRKDRQFLEGTNMDWTDLFGFAAAFAVLASFCMTVAPSAEFRKVTLAPTDCIRSSESSSLSFQKEIIS